MCLTTCYFIVYFIAVYLFSIYLHFIAFEDYFECFACKEMNFRDQNYDYIVVGSGSAGSIVARRLAENKNLRVLLLEAGSSGNGILQIPAVGLMLQNSPFDWQYRTVPQKQACLGLENKVSVWPMGKILGGTGMLNNMIYLRGHPLDYARWFRSSCNYDFNVDIRPYFEKLEGSATKNKRKCSVIVDDLVHKSNVSDFFLQAGLCMGFGIDDGVYSYPGFSSPKINMYKGQRWTPYHQLAEYSKSNLAVVTNSFVEKVLIRNQSQAYGVKYTHLEEILYAKASKGVILSAGTVGTPKILMLSGIGPKNHLKQMKITPIIDLPVGNNLQDHISTGLDLVTMDYPPDLGIPQMMSLISAFNYYVRSKGPWTTPGCEAIAFFNTPYNNVPELQFMIMPLGVTSDGGSLLRNLPGIGDKLWKDYFSKINKPSFTVLPIVLHPKSRGTIRLKNKNPDTPPVIDPKYLSDPYDVEILLQGIEMIKEFIQTPTMRRLGAQLNPVKLPGCKKFEFDTKPYWECYVRHLTLTMYHPVGTCQMGEVVREDFQVIGVDKLFVVDGSVLPDMPTGNPNGPIMLMAERAADIIKHHCWTSQRRCCSSEMFDGDCQC